jgi:hypothetical protein
MQRKDVPDSNWSGWRDACPIDRQRGCMRSKDVPDTSTTDGGGGRTHLIVAGADGGMHARSTDGTDGGMHAEDVPDSSWRDACPRVHHFNRLCE